MPLVPFTEFYNEDLKIQERNSEINDWKCVCVDRLCPLFKEKRANCISMCFFLYFSGSLDQAWYNLIKRRKNDKRFGERCFGEEWLWSFRMFQKKCHNSNVVVCACSSNILKYTEAELTTGTCMIPFTEGLTEYLHWYQWSQSAVTHSICRLEHDCIGLIEKKNFFYWLNLYRGS